MNTNQIRSMGVYNKMSSYSGVTVKNVCYNRGVGDDKDRGSLVMEGWIHITGWQVWQLHVGRCYNVGHDLFLGFRLHDQWQRWQILPWFRLGGVTSLEHGHHDMLVLSLLVSCVVLGVLLLRGAGGDHI